jgi:hypothetical protein
MLPVQRSKSVSSLRWLNFSAIVSQIQVWIRQEIVDDDPWDVETLHPTSALPPHEKPTSERSRF